MTIEETKERIAVMQAYVDGKQIQVESSDSKWTDVPEPSWSINGNYRIKPKPKYRPFKNADECWQEMLTHQPFGWVKYQCDFFQIIHVDDNSIGYGSACGTILHSKFEDIFKDSTFADGAPFGVKDGVWEN